MNLFEEFNNELQASSKPSRLDEYILFNRYDSIRVIRCFNIKSNKNIKIIEVEAENEFAIHSKGRALDREVSSRYVFAFFNLSWQSKGFYLSPEKLSDKIVDLFIRQDIDFSINKKFSNKYRLIGNDKKLLQENFSSDFMNYVTELDYLEIEDIKQRCILCISRFPITNKIISKTIDVGKKVYTLLNN